MTTQEKALALCAEFDERTRLQTTIASMGTRLTAVEENIRHLSRQVPVEQFSEAAKAKIAELEAKK